MEPDPGSDHATLRQPGICWAHWRYPSGIRPVDAAREQEHPVLDWVRATGLRPVLDILEDDDELAAFLEPYTEALAEAYPRSGEGVYFPFRRVFAVAHKGPRSDPAAVASTEGEDGSA